MTKTIERKQMDLDNRFSVTIILKDENPNESHELVWRDFFPNFEVGEDLFHQLKLVGNNFEYMVTCTEDEEEESISSVLTRLMEEEN